MEEGGQNTASITRIKLCPKPINAIPNWIHHRGNVIELSLDGIV
jgi:hypothetical protein